MQALAQVLQEMAGARGAAAVAICRDAPAGPQAAWLPASLPQEPAFLAYSITKTFTAVLFLLLRDEGRLALDDRLARWHPQVPGAAQITLRQMLNHTSGLPDYGGLAAYHADLRATPSQPWDDARFAAETFSRGTLFPPGGGWAYSNPAYMLLKRIAEEVAGAAYADLVRDHIARPLGLARTFVATTREDLAGLAPALSRALSADGTPREVRAHYHPGWVSHGVLASTPSEIARFLDALFRRGFLGAPSLAEMTAPVAVPDAGPPARSTAFQWREPGYGLGLMSDTGSRWGRIDGHNGGGPGYSASAFHAAELGGVSVCAMAAIEDGGNAEDIACGALDFIAAPT